MKLAYLMNSFPMTSTTFIRNEIDAHEAAGHEIARYAIRPWEQTLVDPVDIADQARTTYLITAGVGTLVGATLREMATNPRGVARAARSLFTLARKSGWKLVHHAAYFMEAVALKQKTTAAGITHIHAHFSTNSAAVALLAHRMGGPKYSFTVHGPDELLDTGANALSLKVEHADFVAAITGYCRDFILNATDPRHGPKVHIVRCGIRLADFAEPPAPVSGANKTLVCVGRLCPQKAQTLLPEAILPLVGDHPDLRIILIGDGETRPQIEALVTKAGLQDHFVFAGWKSSKEVLSTIRETRALILPSLAEGLPIVIMEALASQRAVISTRITGIPELLDETCGWCVTPGQADPLTQALRECLESPPEALAEKGRAGRALIEAHHDQSVNAARLRALITD